MREISVEELNENVINLIGKDWMLITAGNIDKYNNLLYYHRNGGVVYA